LARLSTTIVTLAGIPWRVAAVTALPGWRLRVRFNDGLEGEVEMEREVHGPDAGVFADLADPERFAAVQVQLGVVTWPGDIDLAPDAMHAEIKAKGRWGL
jgi:hypothetical protein